jgi:hypothetical protein
LFFLASKVENTNDGDLPSITEIMNRQPTFPSSKKFKFIEWPDPKKPCIRDFWDNGMGQYQCDMLA